MANFNPQVSPTNDPNYIGWSKSIEQPHFEADTSSAQKTAAFAEAAGQTVNAVDEMEKGFAKNETYDQASAARDAELQRLQAMEASVSGKQESLLPTTQGEPPLGLKSLPGDLSTLDSARANGKISPTYYYGKLDAISKNLRARYPGYRDYIDQEMSKVSGVDPANALVKSMIADINSFVTNSNTEKNKVESFIQSNLGTIPNAPLVMAAFRAGKIDANKVYELAYPALKLEADYKMRHAALEDYKGEREFGKLNAEDLATDYGSGHAAGQLNSIQTFAFQADTPQKVTQLIDDARNGKINLTDEQWQQIGQQIHAKRDQEEAYLWNLYHQPDKTGVSMSRRLGGDAATKTKINESLAMFDMYTKAIDDKDIGLSTATAKLAEAHAKGTLYHVMNDPTLGPTVSVLQALKDMSPGFATPLFSAWFAGNMPDVSKDALASLGGRIMTQPDPRTFTFKEAVTRAQQDKLQDPEMYKRIFELPKMISDPSTPDKAKIGIANAAFDPGNLGMLDKVTKEKGQQYTVYRSMTTPATTQEIKRLSDAKNPDLWRNYVNWAEHEFGSSLFHPEITDLNKLQESDARGFKIKWDTDNHRFEAEKIAVPGSDVYSQRYSGTVPPGQGLLGAARSLVTKSPRDVVFDNVHATLERLNSGLYGLSNIATTSGNDPNAYVLSILAGLNVRGPVVQQMLDAVTNSRKKPDANRN